MTGVIVLHARVPRDGIACIISTSAHSEVVPVEAPTSFEVITDHQRIGDAAVCRHHQLAALLEKGWIQQGAAGAAEAVIRGQLMAAQAAAHATRARMAAASLEQAAERILDILDAMDGNPDLEDGADDEPSLGAPEGDGSQVGWMRGGDRDLELEERHPAPLPLTSHDVVARMLALIGDPARWCRGAGARDAAGRPCSPTSLEAVAWSLEGAIDRAAGRDPAIGDVVEDRLCALLPDMAGPAAFNDDAGTAHGDVLALLRRALATVA